MNDVEEQHCMAYAETLGTLIRCETVSVLHDVNPEKFRPFHTLLTETFPCLFARLEVEEHNGSLLMRWPGESRERPLLLMSHHDVVEASGNWTHDPFGGEIADGKLWGRGALDTKVSLWAMLQAAEELFRRCGGYTAGAMGFLFRNIRAFKPLLTKIMPSVSNAAGAMLKTTLAFTMAGGSQGANVLPQEAWVVGNMRYSHHQGQQGSLEAVRKLAEKYDVEMEILDPGFQSPVSDFHTAEFAAVERAVSQVFGDVATVPYIMTGASDCRYFSRICDNCFRFSPFAITNEQLDTIHGIDENITVSELVKGVDFYKTMIREM